MLEKQSSIAVLTVSSGSGKQWKAGGYTVTMCNMTNQLLIYVLQQ